MKEELMSVMREFYHDGVPSGIVSRDVEYAEKLRASTVIKGMRRTGKTFLAYGRMKRLLDDGIPLGRIVHVNFEDERLSGLKVDDLRLIGERQESESIEAAQLRIAQSLGIQEYDAVTKEFTANTEIEDEKQYINDVQNIISNKWKYAKLMITNDYYSRVFPDGLE